MNGDHSISQACLALESSVAVKQLRSATYGIFKTYLSSLVWVLLVACLVRGSINSTSI